jgi:hypothetical protein
MIAPISGKPATSSDARTSVLALRFAWNEDEYATLWSNALAGALGITWLLLVHLVPAPSGGTIVLPGAPIVQFMPPADIPWAMDRDATAPGIPGGAPMPGTVRGADRGGADRGAASANPFAAAADGVRDLARALRGVDVVPGAPPLREGAASDRAALDAGPGHAHRGTPGLGGVGAGAAGVGAKLGVVNGGARDVRRVATRVGAPSVVAAPLPGSGARDAAAVGDFARGHAAQLQSCYEREGLRANPALAGMVSAQFTVTAAGRVSAVEITRRTWSGPGAVETEACIRAAIRGWRFPSSGSAGGTYSLPLSFTGGR